ncbi:MAG: 3-methyladenine DNA glycosylase [Verrucomicrobia bacterium]|nr:3-methyladenine DNA glycosylase [Verrucomicrobiota bacterium]MCH8527132.1 3-methyladenine DNA glycosylase [Kiritimatiellia bacterium]
MNPAPSNLTCVEWTARVKAHRERLGPIVEPAIRRRSRGEKHPIEDFLWEYYGLRPGRLYHWSPGPGVILEEASETEFRDNAGFTNAPGNGRWIDPDTLPEKRRAAFRWMIHLLEQTRVRPPFYGCLGLHEWAMVYEEKDVRHPQLPLRLSHAETRRVVETLPMRCSHYDAFRFFSNSARRFNPIELSPENRPDQEQPACLHANMDLLKWCLKVHPYLPSDLLADAFNLALAARRIDMRASPYDVSPLGEAPIRIETPEGRKAYVAAQRDIAERAAPVRNRLIRQLLVLTESFISP